MTIIQRLRKHALPDPDDEREVLHAPLLREAADLIESLSAQVAELKKDAEMLDRVLIVDIVLPPGTTIHAGCKLRTVLHGLAQNYRSDAAKEGK